MKTVGSGLCVFEQRFYHLDIENNLLAGAGGHSLAEAHHHRIFRPDSGWTHMSESGRRAVPSLGAGGQSRAMAGVTTKTNSSKGVTVAHQCKSVCMQEAEGQEAQDAQGQGARDRAPMGDEVSDCLPLHSLDRLCSNLLGFHQLVCSSQLRLNIAVASRTEHSRLNTFSSQLTRVMTLSQSLHPPFLATILSKPKQELLSKSCCLSSPCRDVHTLHTVPRSFLLRRLQHSYAPCAMLV